MERCSRYSALVNAVALSLRAEVFGDDDSKIASQSFEILFSLEGLVGIEMNLVVDDPEDETRIKDRKERLELNRGSESRWTYRIRPIRFIHVRWTGIYALTVCLSVSSTYLYCSKPKSPHSLISVAMATGNW